MFSWEYFSVLLKNNLVESEAKNISTLWNQSALIGIDTSISNKDNCFLTIQNKGICDFVHISEAAFNKYLDSFKLLIIKRGETEIEYWKNKIEEIKGYSREKAIDELLTSLKLNAKITAISKFTESLRG